MIEDLLNIATGVLIIYVMRLSRKYRKQED